MALVCLTHMMTEVIIRKNILIQRENATCGKATQDVAVYEGQKKCSVNNLSYFVY
jgi:hypothetical protein